MRICYLEAPATGFVVNLIRCWERGEIGGPTMSTSSGLKDYIRNRIWGLFDDHPAIARVLMVRGQYAKSPPFLLVADTSGNVFDMAGKEVKVEP